MENQNQDPVYRKLRLACVGYGTASVLQAYGARSSEVVAAGHGQRTEVTATGARRFAPQSTPP